MQLTKRVSECRTTQDSGTATTTKVRTGWDNREAWAEGRVRQHPLDGGHEGSGQQEDRPGQTGTFAPGEDSERRTGSKLREHQQYSQRRRTDIVNRQL